MAQESMAFEKVRPQEDTLGTSTFRNRESEANDGN